MLSYFPLIDLLRFMAALGVMFFHYFSSSLQNYNDPISLFSRYGHLGVELFFIISGFVIFFSLNKPIKEYALSRFLRLYPLFWFICTITYITTLLLPNGDPLSFVLYLKNLLIVNDGTTALMIDGSYWTLTIEILFYTYIGFFVWLFGKKRVLYFFILWLLASYLIFFFDLYHLFFTKLLIVREAPYFIFGGLLAYFYENKNISNSLEKVKILLLMFFSAVLPFYINNKLQSDTSNLTNFFGVFDKNEIVIISLIFLIILLAVYFSHSIKSKKTISLMKILGGITYPLYLLHQKLGNMIIDKHYGYISLISLFVAVFMVMISYFISIREEKWRKVIHERLYNLLFKNRDN